MLYLAIGLLLFMSAVFSGINLGLMSLSPHELKRKASLGDKRAKKLYAIRKNGNLLLVTVLLSNVGVNAAIAVCLNSVMSGAIAVIASTLLITILGEIFPQALFSRFALIVAPKIIWIIKVSLFILYPIAGPLAWMLDKIFGKESLNIYSKKELIEIISEHSKSEESDVRADEERIAHGAFTFGDLKVGDIMIPKLSVVSLDAKAKLNNETIKFITKHQYSRFPVVDKKKDRVVGVLYVHNIIGPKNMNKPISEVCSKDVYFVNKNQCLDKILNGFIRKKKGLFIVVNEFAEYIGIVSMEDILEKIIRKEIVDEFDEYKNVRKIAESRAKNNKKSLSRIK